MQHTPKIINIAASNIQEAEIQTFLSKLPKNTSIFISKNPLLNTITEQHNIPCIYGYSKILQQIQTDSACCINLLENKITISNISQDLKEVTPIIKKLSRNKRENIILLLPQKIIQEIPQKTLNYIYTSIPANIQCIILPTLHKTSYIVTIPSTVLKIIPTQDNYPIIATIGIKHSEKNQITAIEKHDKLYPIDAISQICHLSTCQAIYRFGLMEKQYGQYTTHSIIGENKGNLILRYEIPVPQTYDLVYPYIPEHLSQLEFSIKNTSNPNYKNLMLILTQDLLNLMLEKEQTQLANIVSSVEKNSTIAIIIVTDTFIDLNTYRGRNSLGWILYRW